jgi:hypothetical protein
MDDASKASDGIFTVALHAAEPQSAAATRHGEEAHTARRHGEEAKGRSV